MRDRQMTGTKIIDIEIGEQDVDIGQVLTQQLPGRWFRIKLSNISQFSQKHIWQRQVYFKVSPIVVV